ncbi:MAG: DUF1554 domain-containing protein [Bdellovibrio sp.]|nr:DUF1554 domain-containing protein [Bdellovibrio sp.]
MKYVLGPVSLLLMLSLAACQAKVEGDAPSTAPAIPVANTSIVVSSKTATAFTLTWPAATDDTTPVASLLYKAVYSTLNNLTDAASAQANGTIILNWTANTLTTPVSSLTNSTTYYIAILVKDAEGNVGLASTSTATLCAGKRIFLATVANGNLGGKTGADATCTAQKPGGVGTVKAMLGDSNGINTGTGLPSNSNGRQACYGNCNSSTLYTLDWVITSGQRYCTSDFSKRMGDGQASYPVLVVLTANVLSSASSPLVTFTALNIQAANAYGNSCSNWTSTSGTAVAGLTTGIYDAGSNTGFLTAGSFASCASAATIICVEQ